MPISPLLVRLIAAILLITISSFDSSAKPVPGLKEENDKNENSCVKHLVSLVDSLVLQAEVDATPLIVKWIDASRVILIYKDISEILWCDGSVLHVEFL
jgi:hypothetical protein